MNKKVNTWGRHGTSLKSSVAAKRVHNKENCFSSFEPSLTDVFYFLSHSFLVSRTDKNATFIGTCIWTVFAILFAPKIPWYVICSFLLWYSLHRPILRKGHKSTFEKLPSLNREIVFIRHLLCRRNYICWKLKQK